MIHKLPDKSHISQFKSQSHHNTPSINPCGPETKMNYRKTRSIQYYGYTDVLATQGAKPSVATVFM